MNLNYELFTHNFHRYRSQYRLVMSKQEFSMKLTKQFCSSKMKNVKSDYFIKLFILVIKQNILDKKISKEFAIIQTLLSNFKYQLCKTLKITKLTLSIICVNLLKYKNKSSPSPPQTNKTYRFQNFKHKICDLN